MKQFELIKQVNIGEADEPPVMVDVYRNTRTGKVHVVRIVGNDVAGHEVRSVMPWDQPAGGGTWTHRWSNADDGAEAIRYVSTGRSYDHAMRTLRRMQAGADL